MLKSTRRYRYQIDNKKKEILISLHNVTSWCGRCDKPPPAAASISM